MIAGGLPIGKVNAKQAPSGFLFCARLYAYTRPPCAATMVRTMAKTDADDVAFRLAASKFLEHDLLAARRQPGAVVTDRDLDLATSNAGGDFDDAARRRAFGGVFQQVAEHAFHQHRVQFQHWQIARQVDAHAMAAEHASARLQRRADGVNGIR